MSSKPAPVAARDEKPPERETLVPEGVVGAPTLRIGEDLIGLGGLLELLLCRRIVLVHVGMELPSQAAKRPLEVGLAGAAVHAEDLVVAWHRRRRQRGS